MGSLSFPRSRRLTERPQFLSCYRWGRRYFTPSFLVYVLPREKREQTWRLGTAVSRKIGPAVWRNRIKRLVRECFRLHQNEIILVADIVVIPKRGIDPRALTLSRVELELIPLMRRIQNAGDNASRGENKRHA